MTAPSPEPWPVVLACAEADEDAVARLKAHLAAAGYRVVALPGVDLDLRILARDLDETTAGAVYVVCESEDLDPFQIRRLEGLFSARRAPRQRWVHVHLDDPLAGIVAAVHAAAAPLGGPPGANDEAEPDRTPAPAVGADHGDAGPRTAAERTERLPDPAPEESARDTFRSLVERASDANGRPERHEAGPRPWHEPAPDPAPDESARDTFRSLVERASGGDGDRERTGPADADAAHEPSPGRGPATAAPQVLHRHDDRTGNGKAEPVDGASATDDDPGPSGPTHGDTEPAGTHPRRAVAAAPHAGSDRRPGPAAAATRPARPRTKPRRAWPLAAMGTVVALAAAAGVWFGIGQSPSTSRTATPPERPARPQTPTPAARHPDAYRPEAAPDAAHGAAVAPTREADPARAGSAVPSRDGGNGPTPAAPEIPAGTGPGSAPTPANDGAPPAATAPAKGAAEPGAAPEDDGTAAPAVLVVDRWSRIRTEALADPDVHAHRDLVFFVPETGDTTFRRAAAQCAGEHAGFVGWRVPSVRQLRKLRSARRLRPGVYWSRTRTNEEGDELFVLDRTRGRVTRYLAIEPSARAVCVLDPARAAPAPGRRNP